MNQLLRMAITISIISLSRLSFAADISPVTVELFVTHTQLNSALDVKQSAKGLSIYVLDDANRLEKEASNSIPKPTNKERSSTEGIEEYKARVTPYIIEQAKKQKTSLIEAWQGVEKAMRYQIKETPAVVIDGEFVIYGSPVSLSVYRWKELKKRGVL